MDILIFETKFLWQKLVGELLGSFPKYILQLEYVAQILNFDATNIFNFSNNKLKDGLVGKVDTFRYHGAEYREKHIVLLEEWLARLESALRAFEGDGGWQRQG